MTVKEERATFSIERKEAATILGVSLRTIDRYIRSGKLTSKKAGYHVYLSRSEVDAIRQENRQSAPVTATVINEQAHELQDMIPLFPQEQPQHSAAEALMYKGLYEHSKKTIDEQQVQLQAMHYKLGTLEVQLASTIPLLTFESEKQKTEELLEKLDMETLQIKAEMKDTEETIIALQKQKMSYMIISLVLIALFVTMSIVIIPLLT